MDSSSDSEEFYDAEEFTPNRGSKRSSICKNINIIDKEGHFIKDTSVKAEDSALTQQNTALDDQTSIKNVVQGRRRFQELRRCMQTEEEDEAIPDSGSVDHQTFALEHPFKIISHDAMSLQSMTSLGRIGRILGGTSESHSNIRDPEPHKQPSCEPSTISDDPLLIDNRHQIDKLYGSQSLSTTDGDNLSVCTTDTDEYRFLPRRSLDKPRDALHLENIPPMVNQPLALPSPASTIESLTREFQDSLELSFANEKTAINQHESRGQDRAASLRPRVNPQDSILDIREAVKGDFVVRAIEVGRDGRTHSETRRTPPVSHSSLGAATRRSAGGSGEGDPRRRSAGDEQLLVRTRSASGAPLSDMEILEQVTVLNLDTGERVPLSVAEHKLPQCINPLSLHIMRLTSEYIEQPNEDENARETDEESESVCVGGAEDSTKETKRESADKQTTIKRKTEKLRRFFGSTVKKTVDAAKSLAQEVTHARHKEDVGEIIDEVRGEHNIKLKASNSHKGPYDFEGCVRHVQELGGGGSGAVWCCRWSTCGQLLATAGQDRLLRIWVTRDAHQAFQEMRRKYNAEKKSSPTPSQESLAPLTVPVATPEEQPLGPSAPFCPTPFCIYSGHTSDLLDVSWSKNYFILSSSMDKTVRLWHISRGECLCCFQHIDFVTAIVFHPRDDRYFLSGSLDGKLRLWNIPDKKVAVWNEVDGKTKLITAANFCQNGKFAVVGTYDGRCIFYTTDELKYHTQIDVRSTRGKNSTGRKISGIEPMPSHDKILVTSNDSRIRLYDLRDLSVSCKYRGYVNLSSQIKASFSPDGKYIVSGSENQCIYIWKTHHDFSKFTSVRRDRNSFWEGIKAHTAVVTCAVFAPSPDRILRHVQDREDRERPPGELKTSEASSMVSSSQTGHVLVSADFNGCIKVFLHRAKPKHSSLPASALA